MTGSNSDAGVVVETRNLRASECFRDLAERIREVSVDRFAYYCPSPGNWGDALINAGAEQFFASIEFAPFVIKRDELKSLLEVDGLPHPPSGSLLVVGGGGGWCDTWFSTRDFVAEMSAVFDHILILPSTFALPEVDSAHATIDYFARDSLVSSKAIESSVLCHDMAFFIGRRVTLPAKPLPRLVSLRNDKERNPGAKEFWNSIDVSGLGDSYQEIESFFRVIGHFSHIVTDRLHIAIAASLIGRTVDLLPGNYDKACAVFSYSMADHYANAEYHQWEEYAFYPFEPRKPIT